MLIFILLTSFFIICGLKIYSSGVLPDNIFKITVCALTMNDLAARLLSLLQSFKEHVMELNTEGLVPKLMSNVHGNEVGNGECQCSRAP